MSAWRMRPPEALVGWVAGRLAQRWARWEADPAAAQGEALARIRREFRDTQLGRALGWPELGGLEQLRQAPVMEAGDLAPWVEEVWARNPRGWVAPEAQTYLIRSTGTSGQSKRLTYPKALARANHHFETAVALGHVAESGHRDLLGGHLLITSGPAILERAPSGVRLGYASGIATDLAPPWSEALVRPSRAVRHLSDPAARLAATIEEAAKLDVRVMTGIPAWVPAQLEGLLARARALGQRPRHMQDLWPLLRLYVWSGAPLGPYREQLRQLFGPGVAFREVYASGEAPLAWQVEEEAVGLRPFWGHTVLMLQEAHAPLDAPKRFLWEAELNRPYRLLVTSPGGLVHMRLGDLVAVTQAHPWRLRFLRREAEALTLATERAGLDQIGAALAAALGRLGLAPGPFAIAGVGPGERARPFYQLFLELPLGAETGLAQALDVALGEANHDYQALREGGAIGPPEVVPLRPGAWGAHLAGSKAFGQGKPVGIVREEAERRQLLAHRLMAGGSDGVT